MTKNLSYPVDYPDPIKHTRIEAPTANFAWLDTLKIVRTNGRGVSPRGKLTHELISKTTTFNMRYPIVAETERKLAYKFMAAETMWIITGNDRLDYHHEIRSKLTPYSDNGVTMSGAYGPKIVNQIEYVIKNLMDDKDSRQAVINIWRENPTPSKDIPCTCTMQFMVRADNPRSPARLHMNVFMRSSDVWMGLPYDMFSFSMVAQRVAYALDMKLGICNITAGSSHLYETNMDEAYNVIFKPRDFITARPVPNQSISSVLIAAMESGTHETAKNILLNWSSEL